MGDEAARSRQLELFLSGQHEGATARVVSYEPMTGGYSRQMAKVRVRWDDGREEVLVSRSDPDAATDIYATDRNAEWGLLQALTDNGTIAIPAARYYDDGTALGRKTILVECSPGETLQAILGGGRADLEACADAACDGAASIHVTDLAVLSDVLTEPTSWDAYLSGLLDEWALAEREHIESVPVLRYLTAWLHRNRPPPLPFTLVHGDYQVANLLLGGERLDIIDWEFAHIGDPREDLGWFTLYSASSGVPNPMDHDLEGFLARYRARTGFGEAEVNPSTVAYFSVVSATRIYLNILRGAGAMARGQAHGLMLTYTLNALAVGNDNWLKTCEALDPSGVRSR